MRGRLMGLWVVMLGCTPPPTATDCPQVECPDPQPVEAAMVEGQIQLKKLAEEIEWRPCPPSLPSGCKMAVLEGDPRKEMLFTVRFQTGSEFEMKPHWHPRNERVTVLEGKIGVGFGEAIDRDQTRWFGPGDYYVNAKETNHFVLSDGPAVVQITGIGPWKANFLEE